MEECGCTQYLYIELKVQDTQIFVKINQENGQVQSTAIFVT